MADIIKKTKKLLKRQGRTQKEIDVAVNAMQSTCVACKHSNECRDKGVIANPYHPKCERHEFVDDFSNVGS